ncbi:MAG: hypothetical protein ACI83L_002591 [Cryomorphaceae bacterium]|jgi:hypothetical protein
MKKIFFLLAGIFFLSHGNSVFAQSESTARSWNEQVLFAISADFARPTIHARNLFHTSIAMYDSWTVYEPGGNTYLLDKTIGSYTSDFSGISIPENMDPAREMTMSYAVYRIIEHRYAQSPGIVAISDSIDALMNDFGYDPSIESTDYVNGGPAELGNYIASQIIEFGMQDGANESGDYANLYYEPLNPPIAVEEPGNPDIIYPNRWQQITLTESIDQSGEIVASTPDFLSPEWGDVIPFAMTDEDITIQNRDGFDYKIYHDPGAPPLIDTTEASGIESFYKWNFLLVPIWQSHLDIDDATVWDISPASIGNILAYPELDEEYDEFYDLMNGGDASTGYDTNPVTGLPYTPLLIKRADYARVLAEFWADGPNSVTPPGHWFEIYNEVSDHELFEKTWMGIGPELSDLEYDVRAYFALGGAMHDAAIASWSIKGYYDYLRPVSAVRFMADKGQSSIASDPNYHPAGIPLIPDYIESVAMADPLAGPNGEHVGKIKLFTWRGPDYIDDPEVDQAGVGWILAENWWPYQRPSFVTPPFAGYVSGHSTYSRTAAELMELMTGSAFFPGGMSGFEVEQNDFLVFEEGPSQGFELQWATYKDASDQCSLSRIWGGIHPPADDIPGRKIGIELGPETFNYANQIIQEEKPYVTQFTTDSDELNADFIGSNLIITVLYDQDMDQDFLPELNFLQSEIASALAEVNASWSSPNQYDYTFQLEDVLIEGIPATCSIKGAKDLSGVEQNPFLIANPFQLDTKKPELLNVQLTDMLINDQVIDEDQFSIALIFNEPCNENASINIEFQSANDMGTTFNLNMANSGWIDSQTYIAAYDLTDANTSAQNIDLSISFCEDLLGNVMDVTVQENIVVLDTKNPVAAIISVNDDLLTIQDYGNTNLMVTIEFDEPMNQEVVPELLFTDQDLLETSLTYNAVISAWISENTCEIHYLFESAEAEFVDVNVSLANFQDLNGNGLNEPDIPSLFSIDTKRPNVEVVNTQSPIVSDQNVDEGQFSIDVEFSEFMDMNQPALVLLTGDEIAGSFDINFINSTWINDTVFRAVYDVIDQNIEIENIGVTVEFALDESGNSQNAYEQAEVFDLDTKNPELVSFSSSDYFIDQSDIGSESFNFVLIFDEEMDPNAAVDLSFSPQDPVSSILVVNQEASELLNPFTYNIVFDVVESTESVPFVDVAASNGQDLAGNAMTSFIFENMLSIDMGALGVSDRSEDGNVSVYPTLIKSGDPLTLKLARNEVKVHFKIRDMNGRILQEIDFRDLSSGLHTINLSSLSRGVYAYQLALEDKYYSGKLIIQ